MKTILIDDEPYALRYLENMCGKIGGIEVSACFQTAVDALAYLKTHHIQLVILDIEMPGMTGIEAVETIRENCGDIGIIFVTGYEEYALPAYQQEAVAYLLKPAQEEELIRAVRRAMILYSVGRKKRVRVHTFGYFGLSIDDTPIHFSNSKSKELLALLVDAQGTVLTMEQIISVLWEERPYDNLVKQAYRKAVMCLNQLCRQYEVSFFVSLRASCSLKTEELDCDYFHFLKKDKEALESYQGEYMKDYGWSEYTIPKLDKIKGTL